MVTSANYIAMIVEDVEKASTFYQKELGMTKDEKLSVSGEHTIFQLEGGAMFALQKAIEAKDGRKVEQSIAVAIAIDDADKAYRELQDKGVEVIDEPNDMPYGRTFLIRTPQGHVLRLYKPYAESA